MNERGKHDHRNAENPDHFRQPEKTVIKIEKQAEPDDGKFQKYEPQSAREQKLRQFSRRFAAHFLQINARSGEKNECRRADMSYPARQEKCDIRFR